MEGVLCGQVGFLRSRVPAAGQGVRVGKVCLTAEVLWCLRWISASDLHSSDYLKKRGLDTASEELPGVIEARYNNLGNPAALIGHGPAGDEAIAEAPLYVNSLSNKERAAVSDDTGGCDR